MDNSTTHSLVWRLLFWRDGGLHGVSDHGEVELDVVEDAAVVAVVERMSTYTWDFRNTPGESDGGAGNAGDEPQPALTDGGTGDVGGDPPPG